MYLHVAFIASLTLARVPTAPHAHHEITVANDLLVVDTTWELDHAWRGATVALALPLPPEADITGATPVRDEAGRIVALALPASGVGTARLSAPLQAALDGGALPLPLLEGGGIQRVAVDDALRFRPALQLGLVTHIGHTVPAEFGAHDRERVDARLPVPPPRVGGVYVDTAAAVREGGVTGSLRLREHEHRGAAIVTGIVFAFVCGAAAAAYRRARHAAEVHRATRELEQEFEALGPPMDPRRA